MSDTEQAVDDIRKALASFIERNPTAEITYSDEYNSFLVNKPWDDNSISMHFSANDSELIDVLNSVDLPPRYSGIWHIREEKLEIAYTVFGKANKNEIRGRSFRFLHEGSDIKCSFRRTSNELMVIAKRAQPSSAATITNYRNLLTYNYFQSTPDESFFPKDFHEGEPISFWIEGISWDDDRALDAINHLNFYMSYYDKESPTVIIHSPQNETIAEKGLQRYTAGSFPELIKSNPIDSNLFHFWEASRDGDPARRFLYNYQILEFSAFYILEEDIAKSVRKLLHSPHAASSSREIAAKILEAVSSSKISDAQKIENLIKKAVEPKAVWAIIEQDKEFFSKNIEFEGGFRLKALIKDNWSFDDFCINWPNPFAPTLRNMRNALSHAREQRMSEVIAPTAANFRKLQSWVPVIAAAAHEVMIYRDVN